MSNIQPKKDVKSSNIHPCPYCNVPCFGKQCKNCHNKMIEDKNAECIDCTEQFYALRRDGK